MKIALLGYGKMGKAVHEAALSRGDEVVVAIDKGDWDISRTDLLKKADVAIEFSTPASAIENFIRCFEIGIPVVSGTTGWLGSKAEVEALCRKKSGGFFYASNFSIGVNLFFKLNRQLAILMSGCPEYEISIEETHHIHKLDAPSGTAISLAEDILEKKADYAAWKTVLPDENVPDGILPVSCIRQGEVTGKHRVIYTSENDEIAISHNAFSRKGFAAGALIAADFMASRKKGIYTMDDLLNTFIK